MLKKRICNKHDSSHKQNNHSNKTTPTLTHIAPLTSAVHIVQGAKHTRPGVLGGDLLLNVSVHTDRLRHGDKVVVRHLLQALGFSLGQTIRL